MPVMANIRVVLDGSSADWQDVFKNSTEIRAGLAKYVAIAANKNTAALRNSGVRGLKPEHGFVAIIDTADKTALGKVAANGGEAKTSAIRAGLPQW